MLSLNAITVRLGGRLILDRASAALPPGSRVGLIGRNGAGKSTLMKVVAGLLEADEGSAETPRAARMGYIAQETPAVLASALKLCRKLFRAVDGAVVDDGAEQIGAEQIGGGADDDDTPTTDRMP